MYIGVVPIVVTGGRHRVGGPGRAVDYAVKMRRLPAERALSSLLRRGLVAGDDVRRIAERVARFHRDADLGVGDGSETVRANVEQNFEQVRDYIGVTVTNDGYDDLVAYSRAFMDVYGPALDRRLRDGRVRDGHGDLHAANVFMAENRVDIIDCIEFNDSFRHLDVADDVVFLAMDLDHYGRPDLSQEFISAYVRASGDEGVWELLTFFTCYRAFVRGKVISFRLDDEGMPAAVRERTRSDARSYFDLAHSYAQIQSVSGRPLLLLVSGLIGSGKSHLSGQLARRWGAAHISSDVTRKELAGIHSSERRHEAYGEGIYSSGFSDRTYEAMLAQARGKLESGQTVVLDASFARARQRTEALEMAERTGAQGFVVECVAPEAEVERRLARRERGLDRTASDGRLALVRRQQGAWEPIDEVPCTQYLRLDTSGDRRDTVRQALRLLYARVLAALKVRDCPAAPG